jgi:hypothetical protein
MSFDESTQDPNIGRDDLTIRNAGLGEIGDGSPRSASLAREKSPGLPPQIVAASHLVGF